MLALSTQRPLGEMAWGGGVRGYQLGREGRAGVTRERRLGWAPWMSWLLPYSCGFWNWTSSVRNSSPNVFRGITSDTLKSVSSASFIVPQF